MSGESQDTHKRHKTPAKCRGLDMLCITKINNKKIKKVDFLVKR